MYSLHTVFLTRTLAGKDTKDEPEDKLPVWQPHLGACLLAAPSPLDISVLLVSYFFVVDEDQTGVFILSKLTEVGIW